MIVCVEPALGYFFRINSKDKWPEPVRLAVADHPGFLRHDSFLECASPIELSDYTIEQSIEEYGVLGTLAAKHRLDICEAIARSKKISTADCKLITTALAAV